MNWLKKGRRQFIIFGITILFAAFLIQLNQVEREGLYETEGKTFEKAKVVEIKKDNTTESGNQIGNQLVSLRLLSGKFRGTVVEAVSSSGYLYGTHCEKGMKVIAYTSVRQSSGSPVYCSGAAKPIVPYRSPNAAASDAYCA